MLTRLPQRGKTAKPRVRTKSAALGMRIPKPFRPEGAEQNVSTICVRPFQGRKYCRQRYPRAATYGLTLGFAVASLQDAKHAVLFEKLAIDFLAKA